jgi:ubiquinone/menaquinone biosynthesis C-methylase UbiE
MTQQPEDVKTQYASDRNLNARIALHADYSTNPYGWTRWLFDHLVEALPGTARIMELGCGPAGLWTANAARIPSGWSLALSDFSAGMVAAARENLAALDRPVALTVADAQAIPASNAAFDGVIANHMLYHVPDRPRALAEIRRALKPGGTLFASTVGERHMQELWDLVEPYVPDIHTRVRAVSQGFTLENGAAQLDEHFDAVVRHMYDDDLLVTEVEPMIAYLLSSNTLMGCTLDNEQLDAIRAAAAARIQAEGAYRIHKASGLFVARTA